MIPERCALLTYHSTAWISWFSLSLGIFLEGVLVPMALLAYGQLGRVVRVRKANTCIASLQQ